MAGQLISEAAAPDSLRNLLGALSATELEQWIAELSDEESEAVLYDWMGIWAREKQVPPSWNWKIWLILAGRGFGKTRTGGEWVRNQKEEHGKRRIALVGATAADTRDVMVLGESGLLACCPPWDMPEYKPSRRIVQWKDGAIATLYTAEKPRQLRGPQHDAAWIDELCAWQYLDQTLDMLMFGLRLGDDPRVTCKTTPKPFKRILKLIAQSKGDKPTVALTVGNTFENEDNLAPTFVETIRAEYEGTNLGRQELYAEIITDVEGALWKREWIDDSRVSKNIPDLEEIAISVDVATTSNEGSADTGIAVGGRHGNEVFILADLTMHGSPLEWALAVIDAFYLFRADYVVVETNNGGDLIKRNIQAAPGGDKIPIREVHASRGKEIRAAPVANVYQQKRAHHNGYFGAMEDQLCNWVPGQKSPDRLDALVWLVTFLLKLDRKQSRPRVWTIDAQSTETPDEEQTLFNQEHRVLEMLKPKTWDIEESDW